MKHVRIGLLPAIALAALLLGGIATDANAQQRTVIGILESTAASGHNNPGWKLVLEEPVVLAGAVYDSMEVFLKDEDLSPLAGKRVSATGSFVQWRTPERGKFVVLELCEIVQAGK